MSCAKQSKSVSYRSGGSASGVNPESLKSTSKMSAKSESTSISIELTLDNGKGKKKYTVCRGWAEGKKDHMVPSHRCPKKQFHPFDRVKEMRICRTWYNRGFCTNESCRYQHPEELENKYAKNTNLCQAYHAKEVARNGIFGFDVNFVDMPQGCKRAVCFHCHDQPQVALPNVEAFYNTDWSKVNVIVLENAFDNLFESHIEMIRKYWNSKYFVVLQDNFYKEYDLKQKMDMWEDVSCWYGKMEKGKLVENTCGYTQHSLPKTWTLDLSDFEYDEEWVWQLCRNTKICKTYSIMLQKVFKGEKLVEMDICVGGKYCKNGVHNPEQLICMENLKTGVTNDLDKIQANRVIIKADIDELTERLPSIPETKTEKVKIKAAFKGVKSQGTVVTYPRQDAKEKLGEMYIKYWETKKKICPTELGCKSIQCYHKEDEAERIANIEIVRLSDSVESRPAVWEPVVFTPEDIKTKEKKMMVFNFLKKYINSGIFQNQMIKIYTDKYSDHDSEDVKFWHKKYHRKMSFEEFVEKFNEEKEEYNKHLSRLSEMNDYENLKVETKFDIGKNKASIDLKRVDEYNYLDNKGWMMKCPIESDYRVVNNSKLHRLLLPNFYDGYINYLKTNKFVTYEDYCKDFEWYDKFKDTVYNNIELSMTYVSDLNQYLVSNEMKYGLDFKNFTTYKDHAQKWIKYAGRAGLSFEEFLKNPEEYAEYYGSTSQVFESFESYLEKKSDGWKSVHKSKKSPRALQDIVFWSLPLEAVRKYNEKFNTTLDITVITCVYKGKIHFIKNDPRNDLYKNLLKTYNLKSESLKNIYDECIEADIKGPVMNQIKEYLDTIKLKEEESDESDSDSDSSDSDSDSDSDSTCSSKSSDSSDSDESKPRHDMFQFGNTMLTAKLVELRITNQIIKARKTTCINNIPLDTTEELEDCKKLLVAIRKTGIIAKLVKETDSKKKKIGTIIIFKEIDDKRHQKTILGLINKILGYEVIQPASWFMDEDDGVGRGIKVEV